MNKIQKSILDNIVLPEIEKSKTRKVGIVVKYNHEKQTIDLKPVNKETVLVKNGIESQKIYEDISICRTNKIIGDHPEVGDIMLIDFLSDDSKSAMVLSNITRVSSTRHNTSSSFKYSRFTQRR